ncbi:hypothetical protein [Acinetobacter higginsii]|uniref:hypothetical protein n=1 Tax=Acinetobacter higginsii TaxID=70347 RepID=UPI001F4B43BE|nr:hypothetical protein [Acinetobacter higginsii]MCH7381368.1 hypothetical protein [Acinetobacter higginsii]
MKFLILFLTAISMSSFAANFQNNMSFLIGKYPYDVLSDKRVIKALPPNIPPDEWLKIKERLIVSSKIISNGDYVVLKGCKPHLCGSDAAIIVFDRTHKNSYVSYIENIGIANTEPNVQIYQNAGVDPNSIKPIFDFLTENKITNTTTFEVDESK